MILIELLDVYDGFGNRTGRVVERDNKNEVFSNSVYNAENVLI